MVVTAILLGALVVSLVALVWVRPTWGTKPAASKRVDPAVVEREVYEKLYGKRSTTVSAPAPHEPSPGAQADVPNGKTSPSKRQSKAVRRSREHSV